MTTNKELYSNYPYPFDRQKRTLLSGTQMEFYQKHISPGMRVLDAGCGTGGITASLAMSFPETEFTGMDMTDQSLEIAEHNYGHLKNIRFIKHDLSIPINEKSQYDIITSIGVIMLLDDPEKGLRNLNTILKDQGILILFLYGKYGRLNEILIRKAIALLSKNTDWNGKFGLLDTLQDEGLLNDYYKERGFTKSLLPHWFRNLIKNNLLMKRSSYKKSIRTTQADTFLVPQARFYSIKEIFSMLSSTGFEFNQINEGQPGNISMNPSRFTDTTLNNSLDSLDLLQKLIVIESLTKPRNYTFSAKKVSQPKD